MSKSKKKRKTSDASLNSTKSVKSPNSKDFTPNMSSTMNTQTPARNQTSPQTITLPPQGVGAGPYLPPHLFYMSAQDHPIAGAQYIPHPQAPANSDQSTLNQINERLKKLDSIETLVNTMFDKLNGLNARVKVIETSVETNTKTVDDLKRSRTFDANVCEELAQKQKALENMLKAEKEQSAKLQAELESLKAENKQMSGEIVDLQSRSMRDNLLFFNVPEKTTHEERKQENCLKRIQDFLESTLNIVDSKDIRIDRAHRVGEFVNHKTRPIVVKFNYYPDKVRVKAAAFNQPKEAPIKVGDQYPKKVQARRKKLIPALIKAKKAGKNASLSYDTLYINGKAYNCENMPPEYAA